MLTGNVIWHLFSHIVPVYLVLGLGFVSVRKGFLTSLHFPGFNRLVASYAVPTYTFILLAKNNPYNMNLMLLGADAVQKVVTLAGLLLWLWISNSGSLDWVISIFMLVCLPNTVLIAGALLNPLYGKSIDSMTVTIIVAQSLVWYNVCIVLLETRGVLMEEARANTLPRLSSENKESYFHENVAVAQSESPQVPGQNDSVKNLRSLSFPASAQSSRRSFSTVVPTRLLEHAFIDDENSIENKVQLNPGEPSSTTGQLSTSETRSATGAVNVKVSTSDELDTAISVRELDNLSLKLEVSNRRSNEIHRQAFSWKKAYGRVKTVAMKVAVRVSYAPITYGSVLGFVYSLLAFHYDFDQAYILQQTSNLLGGQAVGLAIFLLGSTMATQQSILGTGGLKGVAYAAFVRLVIGPLSMIIFSLAFRLKGLVFQFAVLQAVLPQGVISFVFAKEYNLHVDLFTSAVTCQLLIFVPLALVYYVILDHF